MIEREQITMNTKATDFTLTWVSQSSARMLISGEELVVKDIT